MWLFYDNTISSSFCGRDYVIHAPSALQSNKVTMTTRDFIIENDYVIQYEVDSHLSDVIIMILNTTYCFRLRWHAGNMNIINRFTYNFPQTMG